ncbi:hypothetical protein CCR85_13285 [Rhodothalassium salexigens]|nr:hypothetical protein [Rhodothalassium salexigens]
MSADDRAYATGVRAYEAGHVQWALGIWRPLAEAGHGPALFRLARCHETGQGVAPDAGAARRFYRAAAGTGNGAAQLSLGRLLARHATDREARAAALKWLILAERQGAPGAAPVRATVAATLPAAEVQLAILRAERCELSGYSLCADQPAGGAVLRYASTRMP